MGFTLRKRVLVCVPGLYLPLVEIGSYDNILEWKRGVMKLSSVLLLLTDVQMFSTSACRTSLACVLMLIGETFFGNTVCV